jgi:hypothetical protein
MMAKPGRPESDLDPEWGPEARFGFALRQLRASVGSPSYRELASRDGVYFSASVLSLAANGKKIPDWAHVRAYVIACQGVNCGRELDHWNRQWRRCRAESKVESRYRGMRVSNAVAVWMDGWLHRLLATAGSIGIGTATVFLVVGGVAPQERQRELAGGCESARASMVAVADSPSLQDDSSYVEELQSRQRQGEILKQVGCVVISDERSPSSGSVAADFRVSRKNI